MIHVQPDQALYLPEQVEEIAANIFLFQGANGDWPRELLEDDYPAWRGRR